LWKKEKPVPELSMLESNFVEYKAFKQLALEAIKKFPSL